MKAKIITYGCRQNVSDSEKIAFVLENIGYTITDEENDADLVLFNTCAIRDNAEDKVYGNIGLLKRVKSERPDMLIGICGCMAKQAHVAEKIKKSYPYVDMVFGTNSIHLLPEIIHSAHVQRIFKTENEDDLIHEELVSKRTSVLISNVPIMYGCNNFCTYCIVPYVRGRERSRKTTDIVKELKGLAAQGCKEILLLGQNVNSYRDDDTDFCDLLEKSCEIAGIERVRFMSSHPKDFSDKLIETIARNPKICRQIHLPFQSGSDNVLRAMNRSYTKAKYIDTISKLRKAVPDIALTSDIIVGFPTENQADFEETLQLVRDVEFDMLFTFIYSARKGTKAEEMPRVLSESEIKRNFQRLLDVQEEISYKKNQPMLSRTFDVLVEGISKNNENVLTGRTEAGKIVNFNGTADLIGKIITVEIKAIHSWHLEGELV